MGSGRGKKEGLPLLAVRAKVIRKVAPPSLRSVTGISSGTQTKKAQGDRDEEKRRVAKVGVGYEVTTTRGREGEQAGDTEKTGSRKGDVKVLVVKLFFFLLVLVQHPPLPRLVPPPCHARSAGQTAAGGRRGREVDGLRGSGRVRGGEAGEEVSAVGEKDAEMLDGWKGRRVISNGGRKGKERKTHFSPERPPRFSVPPSRQPSPLRPLSHPSALP